MQATEKQVGYIKILIEEAIADIDTPYRQVRWGRVISRYQTGKYGKLDFNAMSEEEHNAEYDRRNGCQESDWLELRAKMLNLIHGIDVDTLDKAQASTIIGWLKNGKYVEEAL